MAGKSIGKNFGKQRKEVTLEHIKWGEGKDTPGKSRTRKEGTLIRIIRGTESKKAGQKPFQKESYGGGGRFC